jgi:hypothetical protein
LNCFVGERFHILLDRDCCFLLFGDLVVGDDDDGVFEILKLCFAEEVYKEAERERERLPYDDWMQAGREFFVVWRSVISVE